MKKDFNIIISGVGGQGLITLTKIIAEAALIEGYDVRTSELHGLSQREGSVNTHVRFGKKIYSPLVPLGKASLIIGLETLESLRVVSYVNPKTIFLINEYQSPFIGTLTKKEITRRLKILAKRKLHLISASEICKQELGKEVVSGVYLLSYAVHKKLIPLKPQSVLKAIKNVIPGKYLDLNEKAFNLAKTQKI